MARYRLGMEAFPDNRRIRALAAELRAMEHLPIDELDKWIRDHDEAIIAHPHNPRCRYPDCGGRCKECGLDG